VEELRIFIAGPGDVDAGGVASQDVTVKSAGSGNADVAPRDEIDIHIAGSGDVNLHTNPRKVETHIAGSGRIHNVGPGSSNSDNGI
jgi:Putative auto-transporter adhesin, head GIN domain